MTAAEIYRDFRKRGGVADLSARAKLQLTGADRVRYLNGQVSNDVRRLRPGDAMPACVTSAKGKLDAVVFIHAEEDALIVDAEPELREQLAARLERYIIADDVTLTDVTERRLFHVIQASGLLPSEREGNRSETCVTRFGVPARDILAAPAATDETWRELAATHAMLDDALLEVIRIERGVPRWGCELGPDTLPAEAGLDRTHIDFHKGCYIGQEVISRIESVGRVNRQLTGFIADTPLTAGMRLFSKSEPQREVGAVTSAAWSFALERPIALGYLKRSAPHDDLIARAPDTAAEVSVRLHDLPFVP